MISLLTSAALAQSYSVDLAVVRPAPVHLGTDEISTVVRYRVADGYPDQIVASDFAPVTCAIESGVVVVRFVATTADWPTTWPSTATCTASGVTLVVNLTPAVTTDDYDRTFVPGNGITIESAPNVGQYRTYAMPPGGSYVEGTWDARLSPAQKWKGVNCSLAFASTGDPYLQIHVRNEAAEAQGYCTIGSGTGIPHLVNVTLDR